MSVDKSTHACADADVLTALARGELGDAERAALLDHALGCQACSDLVALSAELVDWSEHGFGNALGESGAEVVQLRPRKPHPRTWVGWAMAASVVVMLAAGSMLLPPQAPDRIVRGTLVAALTPAHQAVLASAPEQLRWDCPMAQAAHIQLAGADGEPLWQADVERCDASLPPSVRKTLAAGTYLWWVTDRQGERIAGPYAFELRND
ncbi:MAG: hypothetical protein BWZ07_01347 [Alphaproteobacteria bacterium ADurb.BinA280]|nr:MAG: hypothetical protein BWZ07_01347 [Alphaproteobacteria bacterium ADurb.BinA280]